MRFSEKGKSGTSTNHSDDWHDAHAQLQRVQKKSLQVSNPGDSDESEADEVARKVMQGESATIHGSGGSGVSRKGNGNAEASAEFQSQLESKKGGGAALDNSVRSEMESKMGADFSNVKIHTGSDASSMSDSINAKAFTHGQDVFFNQGQYNPSSSAGKELLAHELVHTVQQGNDRVQPKINRRILIAGKPYTPTPANPATPEQEDYEKYDQRLLDQLHNNGLAPDHVFASEDEFRHDMSMRTSAMKTMLSLLGENNPSASFGDAGLNDYGRVEFALPPTWTRFSRLEYHMTPGMVDGKENTPANAVDSIFNNGKKQTILDCNMMIIATQYKALLDTYGPEKFNLAFPGGANLIIGQNFFDNPATPDKKEGYQSTPSGAHPLYDLNMFTRTEVNPGDDILSQLVPGDWIYFKNAPDYMEFILAYEEEVKKYIPQHEWRYYGHQGEWQGEHAVYLGDGLMEVKKEGTNETEKVKVNEFAGFGLNQKLTYDGIVKMMIDACRFEYKCWKNAQKNDFSEITTLDDIPTSVVKGTPRISTVYKMNIANIDAHMK